MRSKTRDMQSNGLPRPNRTGISRYLLYYKENGIHIGFFEIKLIIVIFE